MAVAERYARALAEVAGPEGDYAGLARELESFAEVYRESAELREVFASPAVSPAQKRGVLDAILKRLECSSLSAKFLRVLLAHYRLDLLPGILHAFQSRVYERLGVKPMKVASASTLPEEQRTALRERFGSLTGKRMEIEYSVDPFLLGGVKAQIGSTVYDGTVRGVLNRIREQAGAE
ncbi:MAG: ATP synthase F1 subunit delta [Candidatus Acidiferrales bacterium]